MRPLRVAAPAATLLLLCASPAAQLCGTRAAVDSIPAGNAGALGTLELAADGLPVIGRPFDVHVANGPAHAFGCVGFSTTQTVLPLPMFGCVFHPTLPADVVTFQLDSSGEVHGLLGLTSVHASMCGAELFAQAVATDPSAPGGLAVSDALRIVVGRGPVRFVYVHSIDAKITAFVTDSTGTPVGEHPGSPFATGGAPSHSSGSDNRRSMTEVDGILYTANAGSDDISALRIEPDGSLTPLPGSPFASGVSGFSPTPRSLAVHPTGRFLYVAHDRLGTIGILAIAPDGSLSQAFAPVAAGRHGMMNIAIHPSGQVMWTSWRQSTRAAPQAHLMHAFGIAADGSVTDLGSFGPLRPFSNVVAAPNGQHFYAATGPGSSTAGTSMGIFGFDVSLSPTPSFPLVPGSPFPNTPEPLRMVQDLVVSVSGDHIYVLNSVNIINPTAPEHLHVYSVAPDGALTSLGITPTPPATPLARVLALSEDGTRLYTAGTSLTGFALDGTGALTSLGIAPSNVGTPVTGMVVVQ